MLTLAWPDKADYLDRLFSSHDFDIQVEILDLNEKPVGTAILDDGQINLQAADKGVRRTASLTLSDPAGALEFGTNTAWSGTSLWANRLVRVSHVLVVDDTEVHCTCFVGVPTRMSRDGAEVDVELSDKAALANRGSEPYTVKKGRNAVAAIKEILTNCTGEFRFRFPTSTRRLSKDYSVGWDDSASPWMIAARIAHRELGWQLLYAADGAALLRPKPTKPSLRVPSVTSSAVGDVVFDSMNNRVQGTGKTSTVKHGKQTLKTTPQAIVEVPARDIDSPTSLSRRGVKRYLPLVFTDDSLTTVAQVKAAATERLQASDSPAVTRQVTCIPFFHADADDLVSLGIPGADATMRLIEASIPLGVAGDMSIGSQSKVRKPKRVKSRVRLLVQHQVTSGRKGHRKSHFVTNPGSKHWH